MNYILLHWNYGRRSMEMVENAFQHVDVDLLARKKNGQWMRYTTYTNASLEKSWTKIFPRDIDSIFNEVCRGNSRIINWGNHIIMNDSLFSVNVPSAIAQASDKKNSRGVLLSKAIAVPPTNLLSGVMMVRPPDFPLILRPRFHKGGENFHVLQTLDEFREFFLGRHPDDWYASKVFPKTHEYRVHCAHGRILFISEKPLVPGEIRANHVVTEEAWPAVPRKDWNPIICEESLKSIEVLGLDYGAVDIMYNSSDNSVAICEINTSPSVNTEYSSGKYAMYFEWLIRNDFPEHYPIKPSYVFYNDWLRK